MIQRSGPLCVDPSPQAPHHTVKTLATFGQFVLHASRNLREDCTADQAKNAHFFQPSAQGGGGHVDVPAKFVEPERLVGVDQVPDDFQDVAFPEQPNDSLAALLKAHGPGEVLMVHAQGWYRYGIKPQVSTKRLPSLPDTRFAP